MRLLDGALQAGPDLPAEWTGSGRADIEQHEPKSLRLQEQLRATESFGERTWPRPEHPLEIAAGGRNGDRMQRIGEIYAGNKLSALRGDRQYRQ